MEAAAQSSATFDTLYLQHHSWLRKWLQRKLGCADQAADLAQDTFVRLLLKPLLGTELREPRAYLTTIAHGLMVNHLRRRDLECAYLDALAQEPEQTAPSPEQQALLLESLQQIDRLLDGLPAKARHAFLLSQLEGLRYAEIAERLGVSLSMVKKYMLQATCHVLGVAQP